MVLLRHLLLLPVAAATPLDLGAFISSLTDGVTFDDIKNGLLPDWMNWNFSTSQISEALNISPSDLDDLEPRILNIPGYANFTPKGWNLRFHAYAYREALAADSSISSQTLNSAAGSFFPNLGITELTPAEQARARNLTSAVLALPAADENISFDVSYPNTSYRARIVWPLRTSPFGEVDGFVPLPTRSASDLPDGNSSEVTKLDVHIPQDPITGNASAYLVPRQGVTVISDIDDILRVTKIYDPVEGLLNTFARPFVPWRNMPEIYATWAREPGMHFHYLSTTPQAAARFYMEFVYAEYPAGSFDTRSYNFSNLQATLGIREYLLRRVVESFPERRVVLVGDTSNSDVLVDYPRMMKDYDNVGCILVRNTSATEEVVLPYNTGEFGTLPREKFMFFNTPDDLKGIDVAGGGCRNASVRQEEWFGWYGGRGVFEQGSGGGPRALPHILIPILPLLLALMILL